MCAWAVTCLRYLARGTGSKVRERCGDGRGTDGRGLLQAEEGICRAALEHGFNNIVPYVIAQAGYGCWDEWGRGWGEGGHTVGVG